MKYIHLNTLFLMVVFHSSCGQNQTEGKKVIINSENKAVITSHGPESVIMERPSQTLKLRLTF
jgi:fructose-specific component phosphotransferase system IIB-like protein